MNQGELNMNNENIRWVSQENNRKKYSEKMRSARKVWYLKNKEKILARYKAQYLIKHKAGYEVDHISPFQGEKI